MAIVQFSQSTLLEELETRQDAVLVELDELNRRVETLLKRCTAARISPSLEGSALPQGTSSRAPLQK